MKKLIAPLLSVMIALGISAGSVGIFYAGRADAQPSVTADAGVDAGSGSAIAAPTAPPVVTVPTKPSDTIHDPATDPIEFVSDVKLAKRTGWPLAILVGLFGLCKLLGRAKNVKALAWLGKGKIAFVVGCAGAIVAAMIDAIAGGGTLVAAGYAAAIALFGYIDTGKSSDSSSSSS